MERAHRRANLCQWIFWLFASNMLLLLIISISYFNTLPVVSSLPLTSWAFFITGLIAQWGLLALIPTLFIWLVILLVPKKRVIFPLAILLFGGLIFFIICDVVLLHFFHYHIEFDNVVLEVLKSGTIQQDADLSAREYLMMVVAAIVIFGLQGTIAWALWRWLSNSPNHKHHGWLISAFSFGCLAFSYALYLNAQMHKNSLDSATRVNSRLLLQASLSIPLYNHFLQWLLPQQRHQWFAKSKARMHYPLHPLHFQAHKQPLNILIIGIDTWRADAMNPKTSPNIAKFASNAWQFKEHFSGGNCTQPGLFSLFYGIPASYWDAFLYHRQSPVLIDALKKQGYQFKILFSAPLTFPPFFKNIFIHVPNLRILTPGKNAVQRDRRITRDFLQFLKHRNVNKPFFSFLFYDEVHSWCSSTQHYAKPFQPAIAHCSRIDFNRNTKALPYRNRYRNAVHFDDELVGKVLTVLKQRDLLKNTIVIITSDHGDQFNDDGLGYWGHSSSFDRYETQIPFIVYWPQKKPQQFHYLTSHYDLVPTLMTKVLGCTNPLSDYTVGHSILTSGQRPFLIISSYANFALLTPKTVTTFFGNNSYLLKTINGYPKYPAVANLEHVAQAQQIMRKYTK